MVKKVEKLKEIFNKDEGINGPLNTVLTRFDLMRSVRDIFEDDRNTCDIQFRANTFEDPISGELIVNCNIEQQLQDMELGRTAADLVYDVKPAGYRADVQKLESAKYVTQSFIDKENFYDEYRTFKADKCKYGTAVWFTGLRFEIEYVQEVEKQTIDSEIGNGLFSKKYNEVMKENRFFTPQNVPLRSFLFDDKVLWQNNFNKAEDCIMIETLSKTQANAKYGDVKGINADALKAVSTYEDSPAYGIPADKGMFVLYHYYNRVTKDYIIVINRMYVLYEGKMIYKSGKLPFDVCQHYPDSGCMYGIGICQRVRLWKAYKNNIAQSALRSTRLASGKMMVMGNSGEVIDGDFFVPSGGIGIARMTNAVADMKEIDTRTDIADQISMMTTIDNEVREATGLDLKSPFEISDATLGQTEIREQNKALRYKAVDELMQQSLDRVLTAMLNNIGQFAPVLLRTTKKVKNEKGEVISETYQFPTIQINNVTIKKEDGVTTFTENYGDFGYLELKPETLDCDMQVNITTPATNNSIMLTIEKNKFAELMQAYASLTTVIPPEQLAKIFPVDQLADKMKVAFGLDDTKLVADSKKDLARKENEQKIKDIQSKLQEMSALMISQPSNGQQAVGSETSIPGSPTAGGEASIGATAMPELAGAVPAL